MSRVLLRPAHPSEAAALSALALRSKAWWGYDEAFMAACAAELTLDAARIVPGRTFVLEVDGEPAGFYVMGEGDSPGVAELEMIFLEPGHMRQGHGRSLVEHARRTAVALGYARLCVQSDPHAAGFYRACGGVQVGESPSGSLAGRMLPVFELDLHT